MLALVRAVFAFAALWSAALSFVVQPMLGKRLLPWFGGTPSTWTACMLFFQVALLGGYAIADLIAARVPPRWAGPVGLALPLLALAWLPLGPSALDRPDAIEAPVATILALLASHALVPYVALTTAAPLLQHGYERATGRAPYALYAVSNAGSLIGLLGYPLLLEPRLALDAQQRTWSWAFGVFALAMLAAAACARAPVASEPPRVPATIAMPAPRAPLGLWVALSCLPSALLLAVTAYITVDVAVVPFLWVLPLTLYLLSFIVTFGRHGLPRGPLLCALLPAVGWLGYASFAQGSAPLWQQLGSPLFALFAISVLLHRELVRLRPSEPRRSARFYLAIALGGALGGLLVAVIAPSLLRGFYELPALVIGACVLATAVVFADRAEPARRAHLRACWLAVGLSLPLLGTVVWVQEHDRSKNGVVIEQHRDFFGVLRVTDLQDVRLLSHGRIRHGLQYHDEPRRSQPTFYFGEGSGVGRALRLHAADRPRRIGVVGLGIGTLAVYGRAGDELRFYELSPEVIDVAQRRFDYLRRSRARVTLTAGDGRLSLDRERPHAFDVLVLDAFASDSVPAHLLTVEAFAIWLRQLAPDGVIAAHVSNRHVAVERVVLGAARRHRLTARILDSPRDLDRGIAHARWVLLARAAATLDPLISAAEAGDPWGPPVEWTDGFGNLLEVLR